MDTNKIILNAKDYSEEIFKRCNAVAKYSLTYKVIDNVNFELSIINGDSEYDIDEIIKDIEDMKTRISLEKDFAPIREIIVRKALS